MHSASRNKLLMAMVLLVGLAALIWWSAGRTNSPEPPAVAEGLPTPPLEAPQKAVEAPARPVRPERTAAVDSQRSSRRGRPLIVVEVPATVGVPADGPLVFGLHGRGDTAEAFSRLASRFGDRLAWRFLAGPLPWTEGRAWFSDHQRAVPEAEIDVALSAIDEQVHLAAGRPLAMLGFSQGCMVLLRYLAAHPQTLRAAVCMGGAVVGELPTPAARPMTPILFVHGADDRVVPASAAREAIQAMENRGFATEFIEHGAGHSIPDEELSRISDWLRGRLALDQPRERPAE